MTIKPVASSFEAFKRPSPFSDRPKVSAQDEAPKPAQVIPSPAAARPSPVADYASPVASYVKPVANNVKPVQAASVDSTAAADVNIPQASADILTPSPTSAKPRVSVKA